MRFHLLLNCIIQEPPDRRSGDGAACSSRGLGSNSFHATKQISYSTESHIDQADHHRHLHQRFRSPPRRPGRMRSRKPPWPRRWPRWTSPFTLLGTIGGVILLTSVLLLMVAIFRMGSNLTAVSYPKETRNAG